MSVKRLNPSGIKDQDITVDNLTVNQISTFENIVLNGGITIPDPLELKDNVELQKNVSIGTLAGGYALNMNSQDLNANDVLDLNIQDNESNSFRVMQGANKYLGCDTTDGSELVSIDKDLDFNSSTIDISTQATDIEMIDNNSNAFRIRENGNSYLEFDSTDGANRVVVSKNLHLEAPDFNVSNQATDIKIIDNNATSLRIQEDTNDYITCDTTDGSEKVLISQNLDLDGNLDISTQATSVEIIDNNTNSLSIDQGINNYITCDTTNASEKVRINKDLHFGGDIINITSQPTDIEMNSGSASALRIREGGNSYLEFDTTFGSEKVVSSHNLHLEATNLDVSNQATDIKIIDNSAVSLRIREDTNDYMIFDSTNASEKISFEKDLDINAGDIDSSSQALNWTCIDNNGSSLLVKSSGGNILQVNTTTGSESVNVLVPTLDVSGACLVDDAGTIGSVSKILILEGQHTWVTGAAVGSNILNLSGLDGDAQLNYILEFDYLIASGNANFNLTLRYNSVSGAEYSDQSDIIDVVPASNLASNNGATSARFVDFASATTQRGYGIFEVNCDRNMSDLIMSKCSIVSKQAGGNNIISSEIKQGYENTTSANITSIQIDVNNTNQTGSSMRFRLYRSN